MTFKKNLHTPKRSLDEKKLVKIDFQNKEEVYSKGHEAILSEVCLSLTGTHFLSQVCFRCHSTFN